MFNVAHVRRGISSVLILKELDPPAALSQIELVSHEWRERRTGMVYQKKPTMRRYRALG